LLRCDRSSSHLQREPETNNGAPQWGAAVSSSSGASAGRLIWLWFGLRAVPSCDGVRPEHLDKRQPSPHQLLLLDLRQLSHCSIDVHDRLGNGRTSLLSHHTPRSESRNTDRGGGTPPLDETVHLQDQFL